MTSACLFLNHCFVEWLVDSQRASSGQQTWFWGQMAAELDAYFDTATSDDGQAPIMASEIDSWRSTAERCAGKTCNTSLSAELQSCAVPTESHHVARLDPCLCMASMCEKKPLPSD